MTVLNNLGACTPGRLDRREFLAASTAAATLTAANLAGHAAGADESSRDDDRVAFFLIGDTHYLADKDSPAQLDPRSAQVTSRLIDTLNSLPGREIPEAAGGGRVATPRGVIHAGDLIDTGDKTGKLQESMQRTEWAGFQADFGLSGQDGKLKFPVYEVHGNHDGPGGVGVAIDGIKQRNKQRPGLKNVSANGLHYSWDWGPVHFLNLGLVVGQVKEVTQRRRYNPLDSLDFLVEDLRTSVGASGRPIVITHHVDILRYSTEPDPNDAANLGKEWNPCDVRGYYQALKDYHVAAILFGHTHARNILKWNGTSARADQGLDLFNVDNSSHFGGDQQALLYFELGPKQLVVRELATTDRWATSAWTPQSWRREG